MRVLCLLFLLALLSPAVAQNPDTTPTLFTFGLPNHPGRLHFDAPGFTITEASAKSSGSEFGLRGGDKTTAAHLLAFLFLATADAPMNSEKCRDLVLGHDKVISPVLLTMPHPGTPIALAQYTRGDVTAVRAFAAQGDLCVDIEFSTKLPGNPSTPQVKAILQSLQFDPGLPSAFPELFEYATVLFEHQDPVNAAPIYAKALTMLPADDPGHKWARVTTDQASMSYGMAGDLVRSRAINEVAIKSDPDYPLYYYNLACADAESSNAQAARVHLEQAFARKANTLPGESMPDPTKDDSILKLQSNKAFWDFVQTLSRKELTPAKQPADTPTSLGPL